MNRCISRGAKFALLALLGISVNARASVPDWLRQAGGQPLPAYAADTNAVVLLNERLVSVSGSGEIYETRRMAYKILRPEGRKLAGTVLANFDHQTRITYLKAWSITPENGEYEVSEKDAIETSALSEQLYSDVRYKVLQIPAAEPGSIVGYEYQQKGRPSVLQTIWFFQDKLPVHRAHFELDLPPNWKFVTHWLNHSPVSPLAAGSGRWSWEIADIKPIHDDEPDTPAWRTLAGRFGVVFLPPDSSRSANEWDWAQVGRWYAGLASTRQDVSSEVEQKTHELLVGTSGTLERIRRLAAFVQHNIRYVAIEIGIGGFQPHTAQEVYASGYGDCKDKVTLLKAMLHEAGMESYYVLLNTDRNYVTPDFPTALVFNHVILAIPLTADENAGSLFAVTRHEKLGPLLLFDPTDLETPLGDLPLALQDSKALVVTNEGGGYLITIPLLPPYSNRLLRTANLTLDEDGTLKGTVEEMRRGPIAAEMRAALKVLSQIQRQKFFQDRLSDLLDGAVLTAAGFQLNQDDSFNLKFSFVYRGYAEHAGELFFFHPSVLGHKSGDFLEIGERSQPLMFSHAASESDVVDIALPAKYSVDELPQGASYQYPFASYHSEVRVTENVLHYKRSYELTQIQVPLERLEDLKRFFRQLADDENSFVVMKSPVILGNVK